MINSCAAPHYFLPALVSTHRRYNQLRHYRLGSAGEFWKAGAKTPLGSPKFTASITTYGTELDKRVAEHFNVA
jgi:hypothetical protein